jgi:hypothetical protein
MLYFKDKYPERKGLTMARVNIAVDENVFDEFSYHAQRQNKTLYAFANESLSTISKVCSEGGNPEELYKIWRITSVLRQVDVITLPSDFVDELIAMLYQQKKEELFRMFSELGQRMLVLLKIVAGDIDKLSELAKDLTAILPIKKFIVSHPDKNTLEIDVVGAGRRIESTQCAYEFLKSIITGYGYTISRNEISVGTIRVIAMKRSV